jgi:hypothetical protein
MKLYKGERTIDGIVVTVDGIPLDHAFEIKTFDEKGFEWSYEGSAPLQLALAILVNHFQDAEVALNQVDRFMRLVIANLDNDWIISEEDIGHSLS